MGSYVKKISLDECTAGMFVEDVFNKDGLLLLSADSLIANNDQIDALRRQGVTSIYINVGKGKDIPPKISEAREGAAVMEREVEYFKELEQARTIRRQTIDTAIETLSSIRRGGTFSLSKIEESSQNVSVLTTAVAHSLGYNRDRLLEVGVGGMLHDIGKMRIPEKILNKPGKYVDWEFNMMKKHPEYGLDILKDKRKISDFSKALVIQHHERFNGKGYPFQLKGMEINEISLIGAVADVYDALTSNRVYRAAWTPQKALAVIFQGCDVDYSREIVERFTKQMGIYPIGSFVRLYSGEMGVVINIDHGRLLAPHILVLFSAEGVRLEKPVEYDLAEKFSMPDGKRFAVEISLNPRSYGINISDYIKEKIL
jgi:HD-GYP domain-containing protein (c-di-GMP phosphodiesterase class II)